MTRRELLHLAASTAAAAALSAPSLAEPSPRIDTAWYRRTRRYADLPSGRIAYVDYGHGPAALFVHGYPLNGYQWRGALERLHPYRRCIAPDLLGLGYTEAREDQPISPETQAAMLLTLLDSLRIDAVDLIANDSGGITAQLFLARNPHRVRTLLLTNCDVDENNPPPQFAPFITLAKNGTLADRFLLSQISDKALARSKRGLGQAYSYPDMLTDETIDFYLAPVAASSQRRRQFEQYTIALGQNVLVPVRGELHNWKGPARMVWGARDTLFPVTWAHWLDRTLPGSLGIREVEQANLFFPEEFPDVIAEEAMRLWRHPRWS